MANTDYEKALRLGQKEYRSRLTNGEYPYLPVLDDLLSHTDIETRTDLGLIDIPLEAHCRHKYAGTHNCLCRQLYAAFGGYNRICLKMDASL